MREFLHALGEYFPPDSLYCLQIMTRTKYGGFAHKILTKDVVKCDHVIAKIHSRTPLGGFEIDGETVPHSSLVVYMTPEPRDLGKANKEMISKYITLSDHDQSKFRLDRELLSSLQKHPMSKRILDVDVDDKTLFEQVKETLRVELPNKPPTFVLESRGGYHMLLFDCNGSESKSMHDMTKKLGKIELLKNAMIPLPGTSQGGVEVKWLR